MVDAFAVGSGVAIGAVAGLVAHAGAKRLVSVELPPAAWPASLVAGVVSCVGVVWRAGLTLEAAGLFMLCAVLICVSLTDLAERRIPNPCVACAAVVRVAYLALTALAGEVSFTHALVTAFMDAAIIGIPLVALVLVMDAVLGSSSMGGGDLKLFCLGAFFFGWRGGLAIIFISCVLGVAFALFRGAASREGGTSPDHAFPFGPAISCAMWFTALYNEALSGAIASILF